LCCEMKYGYRINRWDFRFPRPGLRRLLSYGTLRGTMLKKPADVSEVLTASITKTMSQPRAKIVAKIW
jgi:hypothetical protein